MLRDLFSKNKDLFLVLGMVLILTVLFSPIPAFVLDLAIIVNFGFGLTILLLTFYVKKPVDFSTFPSILLIATLFRLALNIAATRLILTGGDAGEVIGSIGEFAVSGNFVVGLVVFFILVIVQFVVVTAGAQRVSEVAARFTLDSMPGQQMSIDADLNMGLIDQKEALRRREELEKEAAFYGSMDGASKFVKGDAIAGIIIILIDIIAGWIIGVVQMGMSWGDALQHFSLLTIGDGIATQIPALIISIATGIIVTRSSADKELSQEVFRQLSSVPRIPIIVAIILFGFMLMPGMPKWPIAIIMALSFLAWLRIRKINRDEEENKDSFAEEETAETLSRPSAPLEIALGSDLATTWKDKEASIIARLGELRDVNEKRLGIAFPGVRFVEDADIGSFDYEFRVFGTRYASGVMEPDLLLAIRNEGVAQDIPGMETQDPAFGLPAKWIERDLESEAMEAKWTVIDPVTLLVTHFGKLMSTEAPTLLTRATVVKLIEEVRDRQGGLIEELIPNAMTISDIQRVLQNLLSENVSIANIDLIIEALVDLSRQEKDPAALTELVRRRMSHAICNQLQERNSDLAVMSLDPKLENRIVSSLQSANGSEGIAIEPKLAQSLVGKLGATAAKMTQDGRNPVLLCGDALRRQMRALTQRAVPNLAILSISEVPMTINLKSFDIVRLDDERPNLT